MARDFKTPLTVGGVSVPTVSSSETLTNKTISGASNTVTNLGLSSLSATGTKDATTYLRGDNTWATVSGGGGTAYTHTQASSSTSWVVIHNLGDSNPSVTVYAPDGTMVEPESVTINSSNQLTVVFGTAQTGKVKVLAAGGSAVSDPFLAKLRLSADVTNATTTPANLTGMSFAFEANSYYCIDMYMMTTSVAATTGHGFAIDTSVAVTNIAITFAHQLANSGTMTGGSSIADNTTTGVSSGVPTAAAIVPIYGGGLLVTGASAGTAQFTYRPEVAASATCKAGSIIRVMKVA